MKKIHIGIIAEDKSDVEVLTLLGRKISGRNFSVSPHFGKGCGSLKSKTPGWCRALLAKGCTVVVVVHDRDKKDAQQLRKELEEILATCVIKKSYVTIPSEELEAWLLSDTSAIKKAFKLEKEPKSIQEPETIVSPKEYLGKLITAHSKGQHKYYVNTEHNENIAKEIQISHIDSKCPSFKFFRDFVETEIGKPKIMPASKSTATPSAQKNSTSNARQPLSR